MQVTPQPDDKAIFEDEGRLLTQAHFAPTLRRPYLFPVQGPAGRSLTRLGHPHDPVTHSHHNSVWVAHHDVNGVSFWADHGPKLGRIAHQRVLRYEDGEAAASQTTLQHWLDPAGQPLLKELRRVTVVPRGEAGWWLLVDLQFEPAATEVVFGKTPFGPFAVRMAKSLGVHDGGGLIRNSSGGRNEEGVFWKPARWVDYSGLITRTAREGVTLFDHPRNPSHPSPFHVRDDGWMGATLTFDGPRTLAPGARLRLSYGLLVHGGEPPADAIDAEWRAFAERPLDDLTPPKK